MEGGPVFYCATAGQINVLHCLLPTTVFPVVAQVVQTLIALVVLERKTYWMKLIIGRDNYDIIHGQKTVGDLSVNPRKPAVKKD